jgi:hypothetical protein
MRGQVLALSILVAISDRFGLGFQNLELWDSNGTVAGGQFVVNGTPQTGGHEIDVSPSNVANTVFDVGTLGGTDMLWAQLLQNNGQLTGWQQFNVTAPAAQLPTMSVSSSSGAARGQPIGLLSLLSILDPDHVGYTQLELWDSQGTTFGGQFVVSSAPQTGGHEIDVSPADVSNTMFDVGTLGGTDTLWARLLQDDGTLTGWQQFTVTAPVDTPPVIVASDLNAAHGQALTAPYLFAAVAGQGEAVTQYQIWDSATDPSSGYFVLDGQVQNERQSIDVSAADLNNLLFQSGSGSDLLWVRASDGLVWSAWKSFTVTAPIDSGPTLDGWSQYGRNAVVDPRYLASFHDSDGDPIARYQFLGKLSRSH